GPKERPIPLLHLLQRVLHALPVGENPLFPLVLSPLRPCAGRIPFPFLRHPSFPAHRARERAPRGRSPSPFAPSAHTLPLPSSRARLPSSGQLVYAAAPWRSPGLFPSCSPCWLALAVARDLPPNARRRRRSPSFRRRRTH